MQMRIVNKLDNLCGQVESLQIKISASKNESNETRQCYEALAKAKNSLITALRAAESAVLS